MKLYDELINLGQYYMAGYIKSPKADRINAIANSLKCHFENTPMPKTSQKETYYPNGSASLLITGELYWYFYCFCLIPTYNGLNDSEQYDKVFHKISKENRPKFEKLYKDMFPYWNGTVIDDQYAVGGQSYVHSIVNYERILKEGLDSYYDRIKKNYEKNPSFYKAMETTYKGIKAFHKRTLEFLKSQKNPDEKLIKAFQTVPMKPATNFYEAMVCVNFIYYLDGADSIGRFDQYMMPYLTDDVTDKEALKLLIPFMKNMDATSGWQLTLGGSDGKGHSHCNRMTELVLIATRGFRRPNLTIRVNKNEDDKIWNLILDDWASGNGNPAIYNEELYCKNVGKYFKMRSKDLDKIAYGGCTETMVSGLSNVGSIECGILALAYLENDFIWHFKNCKTYEDFYKIVLNTIKVNIKRAIDQCNIDQELKAKHNPLPLRSLLIDDCIDTGVEYQAGGARYNGSCFNFAGITNVVNSLWSLKNLAFGKKYTNEEIYNAVMDNFVGHEGILKDINKLEKFGNDCKELDKIANELMTELSDYVLSFKCWRGTGAYIPSHIIFTTYEGLGKRVGATPDGRLNKAPISDSLGAYQGTDKEGPTALLNSVLNIPLEKFCGTPIINMRFSKNAVTNPKERENLKALMKTYLARGGMQLQATVIDQKAMKEALNHPEKYKSLIVRIGGYSEYFNNLSDELKREVIKRYEYSF
ncbi:MAG: hypothetical protein IJS60_09325 [Abditibacteriota bacterium]|nr:hypothetical protein [Abditibacteriota bacterium]